MRNLKILKIEKRIEKKHLQFFSDFFRKLTE